LEKFHTSNRNKTWIDIEYFAALRCRRVTWHVRLTLAHASASSDLVFPQSARQANHRSKICASLTEKNRVAADFLR
jgi:hypothetical protein